jgi:S-adenosylmethionine synthetase
MPYLFTSESVSEGHPDKISDQISDAILDHYLAQDPNAKVACETLVTSGLVMLAGEISSGAVVDLHSIVRQVIEDIGYNKSEYKFDAKSCAILSALHEQSSDIRQGVERSKAENQGAGDQGMMFGYAVNETNSYMPVPIYLSHLILKELAAMRREGKAVPYLRPDSKAQVTVEYSEDHKPLRIKTIVISTQHDDFVKPKSDSKAAKKKAEDEMQVRIREDLTKKLMPRVIKKVEPRIKALFTEKITYHINPTGNFVIGGPYGDSGLTGRKIIVDTYGGKGAHGGGAFSGKDPSKVDRSAAYAARHIAKNLVAAGVADEVLIQVSYAIGKAEPMGFYVNTNGRSHVGMSDSEIARKLEDLIDMRPFFIEQRLKLRQPIYLETAAYGHMGREPKTVTKEFGKKKVKVDLFNWEKLDMVKDIQKTFGL